MKILSDVVIIAHTNDERSDLIIEEAARAHAEPPGILSEESVTVLRSPYVPNRELFVFRPLSALVEDIQRLREA